MLRFSIVLISLAFAAAAPAQQPCTISTVAGGGLIPGGDGGPALEADLRRPDHIQRGPDGLVYFADLDHHRIRRITADGLIETVVGAGAITAGGDGLPGPEASIGDVLALEIAPDGALIWLEQNRSGSHFQIRRLAPSSIVETLAGGLATDFSGDGGPAADAGLFGSADIALGPDGSIYIAAERIHRIRRIDPDGLIDTIAGSGDMRPFFPPPPSSGDGGSALDAVIPRPELIFVTPDSTIYVRESGGQRIRRIAPDGRIDTYLSVPEDAGTVLPDGVLRSQQPFYAGPARLQMDSLGRLYFFSTAGIRRIGLDDRFETLFRPISPFFLDGEEGLFTTFGDSIFSVSFEEDFTGIAGADRSAIVAGDGADALEAIIAPRSVALGRDGEAYFYDEALFRIRVIRDGLVEAFAGTGAFGTPAEGAQAATSPLRSVDALTTDAQGSVYFADADSIVWRIGPDGLLERFAGSAENVCSRAVDAGCGDTGQARNASLGQVFAMAAADSGDFYILHQQQNLDAQFERVLRRVEPDGTITSLPVQWTQADEPLSLTLNTEGRPIVVRAGLGASPWRFEQDGSLTRVQDLGPFLTAPEQIVADAEGNLYFGLATTIFRLSPAGELQAIVPPSLQTAVVGGDGGPAEQAALGFVTSLATDAEGNLYIADLRARRIRRIERAQACAAFRGPVLAGAPLHAAAVGPSVAPGTIVSLFGLRMGPDAFSVAQPDPGGAFPTALAGVRVLVDGVAIPLLFVSANQLNAVLPQSLFDETGRPTSIDTLRPFSLIQIERDGELSWPTLLAPREAAPGLFEQPANGLAAALNQDGSVNAFDNPAAPGSVMVLFGSGGGPTNPPGVDGQVVSGPLQQLTLPVSVTFGGEPAEILFAGSAPGLVYGVIQINARVSPDQQALGTVDAVLTIDDATNPGTTQVVLGP